jgi:hypothetical protein
MNGNPHPPGTSTGGWVIHAQSSGTASTLVVDSVDFSEDTWFDQRGQLPQRCAAHRRAVRRSVRITCGMTSPSGSQGVYQTLEHEPRSCAAASGPTWSCSNMSATRISWRKRGPTSKPPILIGAALLQLPVPLAGAQAIFNPKDWDEEKGPGGRQIVDRRTREASSLRGAADERWPTGSAGSMGRHLEPRRHRGDPRFLDITTPPWEAACRIRPTADSYQPWALAERIAHRGSLGREGLVEDPPSACAIRRRSA